MLIAADIGNTNIKLGVFDGSAERLVLRFSLSAATTRTADEYLMAIKAFLSDSGISDAPDTSVVSSVVPHLTTPVAAALTSLCKRKPFFIGTGTRTGFPLKIDIQSQLGSDIVANAAAAFKLCSPPFAVVDMGTATTITCVDASGALVGTVIAPGALISLDALLSNAALLNDIPLSCPDALIGKSSYDSIRSGAYLGNVYMVDGFIRNIRETLCADGKKLSLVGTGGLSDILTHCRNKFLIAEDLTLIGCAELFYSNYGK